MKRGVLPLIHDQQNTYVFDSLDVLVVYMAADVATPDLCEVVSGDTANAQPAAGPPMAMRAGATGSRASRSTTLLDRVKAMHRESCASLQNVMLTTDDDAGAAFIERHAKK